MAKQIVTCECGKATGVACAWTGPQTDTVLVEWMPEHLRASHDAARNRGTYPHNGSIRLRVTQECAKMLCEDGWADIVG